MWISKGEIEELSQYIKECNAKEFPDIRDNKEGPYSILKNDIYMLIHAKNEELKNIYAERDALSEYMSDISHQLKTPITSMLIMLDLLENAGPEKREEFIRNIKFSLTKMEWLVEALLKMAKIDANAVDFVKKKTAVSEILKEVEASVAILLDVNDQVIEQKADVEISCDKKWMAEALTNIIKNAIEHSPSGSVIFVDCGENPLYYWISVKDSGTGLERNSYSAIFKRFEYSTNENGFGIGMPLALKIVKGQGGDIDVDFGGNGEGATFTIKLFK
ncbi:MAG: HAMP domain-containing histidine kinase [Lachnospiraceae bacterium]|nr:HAMP domain-containing histidine kinase [Lachnospiraceae bacterium]